VSRRKRPSLADIANIASEAVSSTRREPAPAEEVPAEQPAELETNQPAAQIVFKKFTAPFREEQLDQLAIQLASWTASKNVRFSSAEVLRLSLDKLLRLMETDPDQAILELYLQEQEEIAASDTRKFGRSKGAREYLRKAGKL
jgi:hypothetical protein